MTVAHKLQGILDREGWTQEEAATRLGVSRQTVNQLLNSNRTVSPTMALRLQRVFGDSALSWLKMQAEEDLQAAKRKNR